MANEKFTELPTVTSALSTDIICVVQGNVSVQETLLQVTQLGLSYTILNYAGSPVGVLAGVAYQLCWDKTNSRLYICSSGGVAGVALWQLVSAVTSIVPPQFGGTGVSNPTAHTLPVAEGSANFNFLGPLTNGQLLIGYTGSDPLPATLSAGPGVTITNSPGSITISASESEWTVVTATSENMAANNSYIINNSSLVTLLLPATSNVGDEILILGSGSGGWKISQGTGQQIILGSKSSTLGNTGFISSTNQNDSIQLVCTAANTIWSAFGGPMGNITYA